MGPGGGVEAEEREGQRRTERREWKKERGEATGALVVNKIVPGCW